MSKLPLPPGIKAAAYPEEVLEENSPEVPEPQEITPEPVQYKGLCVGSARFVAEVAPLLNMQIGEAPSNVGREDWLYLYNYQEATKPVPIILKYLWEPCLESVEMRLDPRFTMVLSDEDIRELQSHKESKVWLFFWLEWDSFGKNTNFDTSPKVSCQFGLWYTTVREFNDFLGTTQTRINKNRWFFDVRNFKQFRWQLDTRGAYYQEVPYQNQESEGEFPTRESVYDNNNNKEKT